jgi:hypothetical protein
MEEKISEVVIDPKWQTALMTFDGAQSVVLRFERPRFGVLNFLLPRSEAVNLAQNLDTLGLSPAEPK